MQAEIMSAWREKGSGGSGSFLNYTPQLLLSSWWKELLMD